ncbi:hypothetical protein [uncultured Aquimarina sp.]|uniref:tetratricopeptide repeat protein n=1 Tax=uncultured Aquimarina sp. TaxID=575652 RepID=UPI0026062D68|nr:hypothetical protein [uncultured Aquimarina sp.]
MSNFNSNINRVFFFTCCLIFLFGTELQAQQNLNFDEFPEEVKDNLKSLISLRKSKNYEALIELGEVYKSNNSEFEYVFDIYLIDAYFQLRDFDKVIEYTEPYMSNTELLLAGDGDFEMYLGQAYIQKERIDEGCALLKKVKIDDPKFTIAYVSNCFDYKEYSFSVPGNQLNIPTDLVVQKGDVVELLASGKVGFGIFAGYSGPEGFKNGMFRNYNRTQEKNHGELFFTTSSDPYLFYGLKYLNLIESSGRIIFHINDKDVRNNSGYFKATVRVYENSK